MAILDTYRLSGGTYVLDTQATSAGSVSGTAAIIESPDTINAAGAVAVSGSLALSEAPDTVAGSGGVAVAGSASVAETADTVASSGTVASGNTGAAAVTEASDAVAASGGVSISGLLAATEGADSIIASGFSLLSIIGTLSVVEAPDTIIVRGPLPGGIAPLTPQILNAPYNNSLFVDGILNDRSARLSLLESTLPDATIVNTLILDQPIKVANQALIIIIPQV